MRCPRDGSELQKVYARRLELDKCYRCDGLWFDRNEMEKLRDSGTLRLEEQIEKYHGNPRVKHGSKDGYMRCPACTGRLHTYDYSYVEPIYVDVCDTCFGFWLDDGELNQIIMQKADLEEKFSWEKVKHLILDILRMFREYEEGQEPPEA